MNIPSSAASRRSSTQPSQSSSTIRLKCIVLGAANAGKTSILRRYYTDTFHKNRLGYANRIPTQGSDYYTGLVRNPNHQEEQGDEKKELDPIAAQPYVNLQMWDTAGRERFVAGRNSTYTAALSDAFFRHADAAMLVYDATSSTSFTQLLRWHSDLMERMNALYDNDNDQDEGTRQKRTFPVIIVANKMDIFKNGIAEPRRRKTVPQRDVLGLGGEFRGKDRPYEYRFSPPSKDSSAPNSRRVEISTYMATGDTWTTDGSYLDSVLNTEDRSHPDREMVLLWCMRNGLKHFEVSALDGTGIDAAMEALVGLAMAAVKDRPQKQPEPRSQSPAHMNRFHSNKPLDLQKRYAPKEEEWVWNPFRNRK